MSIFHPESPSDYAHFTEVAGASMVGGNLVGHSLTSLYDAAKGTPFTQAFRASIAENPRLLIIGATVAAAAAIAEFTWIPSAEALLEKTPER